MKVSLYQILLINNHVITKIVKTKLIVGSICDIAVICLPSLIIIHGIQDHTNLQAKKLMYLSHPLGITLCQIIIDRDNVNALAFQCI